MYFPLCLVALAASTSAASLPWPVGSRSTSPSDSLSTTSYTTPEGIHTWRGEFRAGLEDVHNVLDGGDDAMEAPTNNTLVRRDYRTKGSCTEKNLLPEWQYNWGVEHYCKRHWKPLGNETDDASITISTRRPEIWVYQLRSYDNTIICWEYAITVTKVGEMFSDHLVPYKTCVRKLKELLSEGTLGKNYCVVDGTEDVLFKSGEIKIPLWPINKDHGTLVYRSSRYGKKCQPVKE